MSAHEADDDLVTAEGPLIPFAPRPVACVRATGQSDLPRAGERPHLRPSSLSFLPTSTALDLRYFSRRLSMSLPPRLPHDGNPSPVSGYNDLVLVDGRIVLEAIHYSSEWPPLSLRLPVPPLSCI